MAVLEKGVAFVIWWVLTGVVAYGAVPALLPIFEKHCKQNYLGEAVPSGMGVAFVLPAVLVMVSNSRSAEYSLLFALVLLVFALLGIIDDAYGDEHRKGFRGHLAVRTLSTGALKAWGGIAVALAIVWPLSSSWLERGLDGAIIALTANFLNLLDLRPGRAGKSFLLFGLLLYVIRPHGLAPLQGLLWAVAGYLMWDLRRTVMMGDVGSNPLGASLGLAIVIAFSLPGKLVLGAILLGLNVLSEKVSFSKVIEANRVLRYLDRLGQ